MCVPVVLALLSVAFAGCTAGDELAPDDDLPAGGGASETAELDPVLTGAAPAAWEVGHHWTYELSFGGTFSMIVTEDNGGSWEMGTADTNAAWIHHREEISYLGKIGKDDLTGSQDSAQVRYFDFPLTEDKTWTTKWDDVDRKITIVSAGETFEFEAYEEDDLAVSYTYDPLVGWFTETTFYTGGEVAFSFTLSDHGTNFTGEVVHWEARAYINDHSSGKLRSFGDYPELDEGTEELWIWFRFDCVDAVAQFQLVVGPATDPATGHHATGDCVAIEQEHVISDPAPGQWVMYWVSSGVYPDDPASDDLGYGFEVWGRSLVRQTIG